MKRLVSACLAFCALVALPALVQAAPDQVVFGPNQYNRTAGPPNEYTGSFTVPASVGAPFLLRIVNGAPNGQHRISSGRVRVNGVQVVGPADFGQQVGLIERSVTLGPNNTVEVRLTSAPGSYITLSVLGTRILPVPTSLAPNPLAVSAGATGTLTATLSPAPTQAGNLSLSSANTAFATVPAVVPFAAGQASVQIPVTGVAAGTTTVTASLNGGSASATVNVTPAAPTIAQLAPPTLTITQGSSGALTVTISAAQASTTTVSVASSNPAVASVPSSVDVPAGSLTASITVNALTPGDAQISASLNNTSATSQVTVTPLPPTAVSLLPVVSTVTLGASTQLTLTISAAQSTDTTVPITLSPAGIVSAPAQVVVPLGQLSVIVPIGTLAYGQAGVTAGLNGSTASAAVNVVPPPLAVTALEPETFTMNVGATSVFTVRINAAQTTNTEITLESSNPAALQVPASVTIAQGATSATFTATGLAVGDSTITASANGTSRTSSVHVAPQPAAIVSLLPSPLPLQQGATGNLTVTINVAQEADTTITLVNSVPVVASVPSSVVLLAGTMSAQVPVTALTPGSTQVTASVNNTSATAGVEVTPPPPVVASIAPAALSLPKGTPGTLRVNVSRVPNAVTAVALTSSDPAVASVPPQVNIPSGTMYAEFPVTSNAVGQATITATLNGGAATSVVTVAPAELVALTLSPQAPTNYVGESVPFTATGTMTDGTSEDFTTRVTWSSTNTTVATILASGVATPLAQGQTTIAASFSFTAVQTGQPVTVTQSTQLTVKLPTPLVLTAPTTTLQVGQSVTVTVTTSDPPPFGGLVVALSGGGTGTATIPPSVVIPEYQTSATFQLSATGEGSYTLTALAQNRLPAMLTFTLQPLFAITGFTPAAGPIGTAVAISGFGFDPNLAGNTVRFNGEQAVVASGGATLLNVIVPPRATTGSITVSNFRGTVASATPFTVQEREAFDIALSPASIQVPQGGLGATRVRLSSTGINPYPYAASVTVSGLPAGVSAALDRPTVALNQDVVVTFTAAAGAGSGSFNVTLTAIGASGVATQTVTKTLALQVLAAGSTTISGRVLHAGDDAPFEGARVRLGGQAVFTDASGSYRFVSPAMLGEQVLLIDGSTLNGPDAEYPSGIAMPVSIVAGQDNKALTAFIARIDPTKFTAIVPGAFARVENPEIPNFALRIPQGATLYGWDGQPITKINVRTTTPDRLPIRPIPAGVDTRTVYLYYFFKEGGANPTQPIPVTMPNDIDASPGEQVTLWYYDESATPDATSNQWRVMGSATVSQDGKSIVSNPGVGMPKFCCGASFAQRNPGPGTGPNYGGCNCGNPVNVASGNGTVFRPRPFGISKIMPVDPNLQYRSTDPRVGLFGRGMSFTYDWFAQSLSADAVRVIDPSGVSYTLSREADGVFRSRNGRSRSIEMEVTATSFGRTLRLADGMRYDFDGSGRLLGIQDLAGNRTSFTLNAQGFPTSMTDSTGKVYAFQLVGAAPTLRISRITDPAGRFVEFTYDASQRLQTYKNQGGGITQLQYDANNRVIKQIDPRLAETTYEYDSAGRTTREVLPEGGEHRFAYTTVGNTVTETRHTDPNGDVTTYRFNGLGYEVAIIDAAGRVTRFDRDPVTNFVRRKIDPAGRVTQYTYNARGDVIRTIDPDNKQTVIDYDLRFRKPVRIENALGHVTGMEYDTEGNLAKVTNAENEMTAFTYTANGQIETVTDPLNLVSRFTYDSQGNLLTSLNPANETAVHAYDQANRLIAITDALNRSVQFTHDNLDRVTEIRDPLNGVAKYTFDPDDNITAVRDQNDNPIETSVYDLRNRLTQRTDAKNRSTLSSYDFASNLLTSTDRRGRITTYTYDALNRIVSLRDHDGRITQYSYDLAGNIARITDTQSGEILMSYDVLDRIIEVITAQGTITYTYDAIGRRTSRVLSGGDVMTYGYDKANRLKTLTFRGQTTAFAYDAAGRATERVLPNGIKVSYGYDDADRVTSIAYKKTDDTPIESIAYAYDAGGQRIQKGHGPGSLQDSAMSATYDTANRLTAITINGEVVALTYDDNGNLASKIGPTSGTTLYAWDARNQLVSISGPSGSASFKYDGLGRRIEKTVNGASVGFLYDGRQAVAELAGNSLSSVYVVGQEIDEVLARYGATGDKTLLTDALMSVVIQANNDQSVANFYAYSPYGEATSLGPDGGNALQFTARENDGIGLYYYRARYYDPLLKRFISEDPIGLAAGTNVYGYVRGDPVGLADPLGLYPNKNNGNKSGGYNDQDMVCTIPFPLGNAANNNKCVRKCCEQHDLCYSRYRCNASSWRGNPMSQCGICNVVAVFCIVNALSKPPQICGPCQD